MIQQQNRTILIVDDEDANRTAFSWFLRQAGFGVGEATSGEEALRRVREDCPDLVILDVRLPDIDGYEVCRRIKSDPALALTAVIQTSALYANPEEWVRELEGGADAFLAQPVDWGVLLATVQALLRARHAEAALRESEERHKQAEEALHRSVACHSAILASAVDCIIGIDEHGRVTDWNPAAEATFGYSRADVLGREMAELIVPPSLREQHRQGLARCLATGVGRVLGTRVELTGMRADGTEFPVEVSIVRISLDGPGLFIGFVRDISDRKAAEHRLAARQAVTEVLAEAPTLADAAPHILRAIGEHLHWDYCALWEVEQRDNRLRCVETWHAPSIVFPEFEAISRQSAFAPGVGLPGRVWTSGEPTWIVDVLQDTNFPRLPMAAAEGLHTGVAFPILLGRTVLGVMEFFTQELREPDQALLQLLEAIASQVGQFIERRRAEEELATRAGQMQNLFDGLRDVFFSVDTVQGRALQTSPACEQIFGVSQESFLRNPRLWREMVHPDDATLADIGEQGALEGHSTTSAFRIVRPDGEIRWVEVKIVPTMDEAGRVIRVDGVISDITERKRGEEALSHRARLASLGAEVGVALTQCSGLRPMLQGCTESIVRHLDAAFARIWTLNDEPPEGHPVLELQASAGMYTHLDGPHCRVPVGQFKIGRIAEERKPHLTNAVIGDPRVGDQEWARREGMIAFAGYPLIVDDRVIGVMAMFARQPLPEATLEMLASVADEIAVGIERKRSEDALAETNRRLEETLQELQRAQSRVIEQERLRALGQMASGIAHDFNNALAPILGFTELLLHQPQLLDQQERVKGYLEMMYTAASDGASVVRRLQEFYRQRDAREVFGLVKMNRLIGQCIDLTQPRWKDLAQARGTHITIKTELEEVPPVAGNEAHLREALTNLIFNAVDAMPQGGTLTLRTRTAEGHRNGKPSDNVEIEVSDSGTGMSDEVRQRCLEPFFTTKGEHGTGLGLSMVYGIIHRHDGMLDIRTRRGEGTSFILTLPVFTGPEAQEAATMVTRAEKALSVLVVDDEPMVGNLTAEFLKVDGHAVHMTTSPSEALHGFQHDSFDLVVTDRAMPEMNGDQFAAAVKAIAPSLPVILLTGFGDLMHARDEHPTGVDIVLSKPVSLGTLREAVANLTAG
jgi:PAS domain S-box-containing protein